MGNGSKVARHLLASASGAALVWIATPVYSQVASTAEPANTADALNEVVVTGQRFGGRIVTDSPTPIDLVSAAELQRSGQVQLQQILKTAVPSFSVTQPSTAGALDFTSTPTLRGLSPGELLLLVNGKRRHSTGYLNVNNQVGRGDVAYDLSAIPTSAIAHVEVLRDGASAQYGADAIAGVINLVLDKSLGVTANAMTGATTHGDGFVYDISSSYGLPLANDGVLRLTARYQHRESTNRAKPDTRQQYFGRNPTTGAPTTISGNYGSGSGLTPSNGVRDPREATFDRDVFQLGDAEFRAPSFFLNAEQPLNEAVTLYAFGGYTRIDGKTPNFVRRAGQDETVRALHPDGYRPDSNAILENESLAFGAKGAKIAGFAWDLSTEYGRSLIDNTFYDTNNPSLGLSSPTSAYNGGTRFSQWTTNLDLSREIPLGEADPLKVAAGLEYRKEYYDLVQGELASYQNGGRTILDGPNQGRPAPIGTQSSPGLTPQDATSQSRDSEAVYAEVERQFLSKLLLSGAVRHERFSDFGNDTTYKVATRLEIAKPLALRASYSTGFRAPHLAQSFYSATTTSFISGNPVTLRLFPVDSPVARALGASDLRPEKSKNLSVGTVFTRGGLTLSLDAYQIELTDRIALSSNFQDARITNYLATQGYTGIGAVSYMSNAIDTTTRGIDVTGRYRFDLSSAGNLTATFAGNHNKTEFDRIAGTPAALATLGIRTPLFDLTQQVRLTSASPKDKISLGLNWEWQDLSVNLTNTYYGEVSSVAFTNLTPAQIAVVTAGYDVELRPTAPAGANSQVIQTFGAKTITDLSLSYRIRKLDLTIGGNNLFDIYPDRNIASTAASVAVGTNGSDNAGTFPYNYISPFGYNGRFVYAKASFNF
jgi:iron complex outermembrane receptor protein